MRCGGMIMGGDQASSDKYIGHAMKFMRMCRMWRLNEEESWSWQNFVATILAVSFMATSMILAISEVIEMRNTSSLAGFAASVGPFLLHFVGFFKSICFACRAGVVSSLVGQFNDCYRLSLRSSRSTKDLSMLDEDMQRARRHSKIYLVVWGSYVVYTVTHWCINPVLLNLFTQNAQVLLVNNETKIRSHPRTLPFSSWFPWDTTESPGYEWAYFFQFTGHVASGIGTLSFDIFYLTLVLFICAQLRYLNYSLSNCDKITRLKGNKEPMGNYLREKLVLCQHHHECLLKLLSHFGAVTYPIIFGQCIGTLGVVCLTSFEALTMRIDGDPAQILILWSMLEFFAAGLFELFVFCYHANEITNLGMRIGDSSWECGWELVLYEEKTDLHRRNHYVFKNLSLVLCGIIRRAQKPIRLTGGPFYVLSLDTFQTVIGVAFSYAIVLRNMNDK